MAYFYSSKYGSGVKVPSTHHDGSDDFANFKQMVISFQHVPTGKAIYFKAFITAFNENYSSDWSSETVYGRADPIYMFKQTTRKITLAFKIPATTQGEAFENLGKVQGITQFLYPTYADVQQAQTISQSPLVRLKVMNLGRKIAGNNQVASGDDRISPGQAYENYRSSADAGNGLLGVIGNLVVNHNLEGEDGVIDRGANIILPKLLDVNLDFNVIHEHALGWDAKNRFSEKLFPYGVDLVDDDAPPPPIPAPDPVTDNDAVKADQEANVQNVLENGESMQTYDERLDQEDAEYSTSPGGGGSTGGGSTTVTEYTIRGGGDPDLAAQATEAMKG